MMVKFMSRYPDGTVGVALLVMRFSCALAAFPDFERLPLPRPFLDFAFVPAALIALALVLGLGTRAVASVLVVATLTAALSFADDLVLVAIAQAGCCASLVILGSGAYSIDANLFGRRVFRFEPRAPNRGSEN